MINQQNNKTVNPDEKVANLDEKELGNSMTNQAFQKSINQENQEQIMVQTIREGYKNTEIGVIPEEWEVVPFDTIADKSKKWSITGGPFGSNLKASDYTEDGIQIIQLQNIGDGKFIDDYQIFTSDAKANELISCNIYPGEIILSKMGDPVARACFIPAKAKRFVMASDGIRLVVNKIEFSKKFIHDYINSIYFRRRAFEISTGSTRLRIGLPELKSLLVIKPTLTEQTAIATALSDADALISSLENLITKKRNIKQGAMQKLLQPKEGWEVKKLGDVGEIIGGGTPSSFVSNFWNGSINWFTPTEIGKSKYTFESKRKITKEGFINCSGKMLPIGTVLLTSRAGIGDVSILLNEGCTNQGFQSLVAKDGYYYEYLYYLMQTLKAELIQNASGSTFLEISPNKIKQIEVSIPQIQEQIRIATILSDMDVEIQALETKLEKYRKVKLGMMQNLLTGKIRLV